MAERELRSRLLLQVHDELVLEVPDGEVDAAEGLLRGVMEGAACLSVPLVVEVGPHRRRIARRALGVAAAATSPTPLRRQGAA